MRAAWAGVILLLLIGCDQRKPQMSDAQMQKLRVAMPWLSEACLETIRWGGIPKDDCEKRLPPARYRGLWRNDFETPLFCPAPARECKNAVPPTVNGIWLELRPTPAAVRDVAPGGLYAIEFIGRKSAGESLRMAEGYAQDIVVDRVISIREVEAPPKE